MRALRRRQLRAPRRGARARAASARPGRQPFPLVARAMWAAEPGASHRLRGAGAQPRGRALGGTYTGASNGCAAPKRTGRLAHPPDLSAGTYPDRPPDRRTLSASLREVLEASENVCGARRLLGDAPANGARYRCGGAGLRPPHSLGPHRSPSRPRVQPLCRPTAESTSSMRHWRIMDVNSIEYACVADSFEGGRRLGHFRTPLHDSDVRRVGGRRNTHASAAVSMDERLAGTRRFVLFNARLPQATRALGRIRRMSRIH